MAQIVTIHGEGYTERVIAAEWRCSQTAVHNAVVKFNAGGTTSRQNHSVKQIVMRSPKKDRPILRLKDSAISASTVSRRLSKEFGF